VDFALRSGKVAIIAEMNGGFEDVPIVFGAWRIGCRKRNSVVEESND
jgi:hypothetical protein